MADERDDDSISQASMSRRAVIGAAPLLITPAAAAAATKPASQQPGRKLVKVMTAVRRKAGVDRETFLHDWTVVHAQMANGVPGVVRFIVNPVKAEPGRSDVPELMESGLVDGFAETWIDAEAIATMGSTPQAQAWYKHGAEIFGAAHNFQVEEIVILDRS